MENRTRTFIKKGVVFSVIFLLVSTAIVLAAPPQRASVSSIKQTMNPDCSSMGETELKYYAEEGLSTTIGVCGDNWMTAIRLTQDEMAAYRDWTLTKVNVAFHAYEGISYVDAKIHIFDKGDATHAGPEIVSDTEVHLNTTGIHTIPLVTPVNLSGHEELWVAVEWTEIDPGPGVYYAWLDTLSGPHVPQKGDWYYLNNAWGEIYIGGADYDGNWGIGAIIEGSGAAKLEIGSIKGPLGIAAEVRNIGETVASNITWSINVTGGFFHMVQVLETGTIPTLIPGASSDLRMGMFFGFGKILIVVSVQAENALEMTVKKNGFLWGPFVLQIK